MAFNPSSTIHLCNVPFDSSYKHQIYFPDSTTQYNYFVNKKVVSFADYLTIRKTLPSGQTQSSVKVGANIDAIQKCNYMMYQNANHGTKWFYAFIEKLVYINENTTEVIFETDVYQTWRFDVTLKRSYVVREHSVTDNIGDNVVPEKFNSQDFTYQRINKGTISEYGYLVTSTQPWNDSGTEELKSDVVGMERTGIFQGLFFYYFTGNTTKLSTFLKNVENESIVSISVIPKFNVSNCSIGSSGLKEDEYGYGEGWIYYGEGVPNKTISIDASVYNSIDGYQPKNKKLFTSPYFSLVVTNNSGDEGEYVVEDFADRSSLQFKMYGDLCINPSVTLVPLNYKDVEEYHSAGISIKNFPQCSFNTDTFKMWLARNTGTIALETMGNLGQMIAGAGVIGGTSGAGSAIGVSQIVSGAQGILGTINTVYQASKEPNKAHTGATTNNLLTAIGKNKFDFYIKRIKSNFARTVDDFFTMYGYQTNQVKVPNVSSRPYYNYVETIDVNITGGIPSDDMAKLKAMYNSGVTLWKHTATMYDYSVNNAPTE